MKKLLLIFFTTFFLCITSWAQNLVPNHNFDQVNACPDYDCQIYRAEGWFATHYSPDFVHECAPTYTNLSVPNHRFGSLEPASGNGYAILIAGMRAGGSLELESLGIELIEPLMPGQKYYVSFKAALSNHEQVTCGFNKLGALLTVDSFEIDSVLLIENNCGWVQVSDNYNSLVNNFAHVYATEPIIDTSNWTIVSGSFIADASYKYINIGLFFKWDFFEYFDNLHLEMSNPNHQWCTPEDIIYFIDDVYFGVEPLTNKYNEEICSKIDIYPNPSNNNVNIIIQSQKEINAFDLKLFDFYGNEITNQIELIKFNEKEFQIRRNGISGGNYILRIIINNEVFNSKLLLN